ncbi:MAG TPA: 50S ribosomal protein L19, partial [Candidatus Paceibacterota bacterium]|nr:50S ribosomal protein L19 [Candidatus Paceibacterota bacterium]
MATANITISPVNMQARKDLDMRSGDTVRVSIKIEEKGKTRLQVFEGTVLARKGGREPGATFTVRRVSGGYGVEKIFPLYSPLIDKIEVTRRVKTRRAKLYHIREKAAREIRRQMRKMHAVSYTTVVAESEKAATEEEAPVDTQEEPATPTTPEATE